MATSSVQVPVVQNGGTGKPVTAFQNTTVGKTVRTFLQSAAGILLLFVISPDFRAYLVSNYPAVAIYLPLLISGVTAVHNFLDKSVPNY